MWASDAVPTGCVPVQWVTSDETLADVMPPQEIEALLCEECEDSDAVVFSEADKECLCGPCCKLLYPPLSTGLQHPCFSGYKIRVLCRGDRSHATRPHVQPDHYSQIITEEKWESLGKSLRTPSAVEAPRKNLINGTSRSNRPAPKYREGDVVVFDVEDLLPSEVKGQERLPPWRRREIWGVVMGTSHPRLGQYGHATRDGDDHEPWYRVRCQRWVKVGGAKPGGGGEGDSGEGVANRAAGRRVELGGKLCSEYEAEQTISDEVYETGHTLDRRIDQVREGIAPPGFKDAPFAREKTLAWIRDRQLKSRLVLREFAVGEIHAEGLQADATSFPTVVLVLESKLGAPAERRAALVRRRAHQLDVCLRIVDGWLYERGLVKGFIQWVTSTFHALEEERCKAAKVLQRAYKGLSGRLLKTLLDTAVEEKKKGKHRFRFLRSDSEKANGMTMDGKRYFATLKECEAYIVVWQEMAERAASYMCKAVKADQVAVLKRWRAYVSVLKKLDRVPITHLGDAAVASELFGSVPPLGTASVLALHGGGYGGHLSSSGGSGSGSAGGGGGGGGGQGKARIPPWHPALGFAAGALPPLPRMWSHRNPLGQVVVERQQKFNSYQAGVCQGPSDTSNWVIPGLVLCGAYPEGKARRKGRQPTPESSVGQALLSNVGTIVCLLEDQEMEEFERLNGLAPLEAVVSKEHKAIRALLKTTVVRQETAAAAARKEADAIPVYKKKDQRYAGAKAKKDAAAAKERISFAAAERAKLQFSRFPVEVQILRLEVGDGRAPTPKALEALLVCVESRLRDRTGCVFVVSRLGHGRASLVGACLLGRLYGLKCREALERVQSSHDARVSVLNSGRVISAPSTVEQVRAVETVLAPNETMYGDTVHHTGEPTKPESSSLALPKLRGRGPPIPLPPQLLLRRRRPDDDKLGNNALAALTGGGKGGGAGGRSGGTTGSADTPPALEPSEMGEVFAPFLGEEAANMHTPSAAVLPDLRLTTAMEEETKGKLGNVRKLRPWAPAVP